MMNRIKSGFMPRTAWISLLCALFLLAVGASSVFAYVIINGSDPETPKQVEYTFVPGKVEMAVNSPEKNVNGEYVFTVSNRDNISAYVRVVIVYNWVAADGTVHYERPNVATPTYTGESDYDWVEGVDGYFYYPAPVDARTDVPAKIVIKAPTQSAPDGYTFSATVIAEGIQAEGVDPNQVPAIESVWKDNKGSGTAVATIGENGILNIHRPS